MHSHFNISKHGYMCVVSDTRNTETYDDLNIVVKWLIISRISLYGNV